MNRLLFTPLQICARLKGAKFGKLSVIRPGYDWLSVSWRNVKIGNGATIGRRAWIQTLGKGNGLILIGDNCSIGRDAVISSASSINIGRDCLISFRVTIVDHDHDFVFGESPVGLFVSSSEPVDIGERTFIGANSVILKGVSIGRDSIVGAGSVVTHSFPRNSIIAGNPAILVRSRD